MKHNMVTSIKYCPTDNMIGDNMGKELQWIKFNKFCNEIIGFKLRKFKVLIR